MSVLPHGALVTRCTNRAVGSARHDLAVLRPRRGGVRRIQYDGGPSEVAPERLGRSVRDRPRRRVMTGVPSHEVAARGRMTSLERVRSRTPSRRCVLRWPPSLRGSGFPAGSRLPAADSDRWIEGSVADEEESGRLEELAHPLDEAGSVPTVDDAVVEGGRQVHHLAGTHTPPVSTGRSTILLTPMMATSGALMIGVEATPPSAPRLVMVIVEPLSSASVIDPSRAASARRAISAATPRCRALRRA